jgi:hypothetical protein
VVEEKPAAGKAPVSKDKPTPSPPAAEKPSKKRTADEAGLPAAEPPAKAASAEAEKDYSKLTVAQLKEKLKGARPRFRDTCCTYLTPCGNTRRAGSH